MGQAIKRRVTRVKPALMSTITYVKSSVRRQTPQCHDVEPSLPLRTIFSTADGAHHDVIEIGCKNKGRELDPADPRPILQKNVE